MDRNRIKKEWLTLPNFLSLFRLLLIPVYLSIYHRAEDWKGHIFATLILALSCITDMIDGKIARRFEMTTTVGKILDPLADKMTQFSLILWLTHKYRTVWVLFAVFLAKELFQLVAAILYWRKGKILKEALFSGKLCTTVLFVSIIIMALFVQIPREIINTITLINVLFMLLAFFDYLITYLFDFGRFEVRNKK